MIKLIDNLPAGTLGFSCSGQISGEEREPVHVTVPTHLIVRGSTAPRA